MSYKKITLMFLSLTAFSYGHGVSDNDKLEMVKGGLIDYLSLGAKHMVTGYDHILFLVGVIFFLTRFSDIAKFVSAFTIGHSVTLIFATLYEINANYYLIDAVIALSVIYKGFENLKGFEKIFKINSPNLITMVFIFGLIHGFGLSTRLQQLPLGDESLLLKIIFFNVGVELGQIMALVPILFLINLARKQNRLFEIFSKWANWSLILTGTALLFFQLNGYFVEKAENNILNNKQAKPQEKSTNQESDQIIIPIQPGKGLEYKLKMEEGQTIKYSWESDGESVYCNLHGEPLKGNKGAFKSLEKINTNKSSGEFTASFHGSWGWWWKNNSNKPILVTLNFKGDYEVIGLSH